jgi:hypothetical protein
MSDPFFKRAVSKRFSAVTTPLTSRQMFDLHQRQPLKSFEFQSPHASVAFNLRQRGNHPTCFANRLHRRLRLAAALCGARSQRDRANFGISKASSLGARYRLWIRHPPHRTKLTQELEMYPAKMAALVFTHIIFLTLLVWMFR